MRRMAGRLPLTFHTPTGYLHLDKLRLANDRSPVSIAPGVLRRHPDVIGAETIIGGGLIVSPAAVSRWCQTLLKELASIMEASQREGGTPTRISSAGIQRTTHRVIDHDEIAVLIGHHRSK